MRTNYALNRKEYYVVILVKLAIQIEKKRRIVYSEIVMCRSVLSSGYAIRYRTI
jgi:hypothetical protein